MSNTPAPGDDSFDEFARRWLFAGTRKDELAACMVDIILLGPLQRVPQRFRKIARALRILRSAPGRQKKRKRKVR